MTTLRLRTLAGALVMASSAACSLLFGGDLDGFSGACSGDCGVSDGGPGRDGNVGDENVGDVDAGSFCRSKGTTVTFCRDFDDESELFTKDFVVEKASTDTLTVDSLKSVSPHRSLVSEIAANSRDTEAYMHRLFDVRPSDISLSLDILMEEGVSMQGANVASLVFEPDTPNEHALALFLSVDGRNSLEESYRTDAGKQTSDHEFTGKRPQVGKWAHYDIHVSSGTRRVTVALDGTDVVDQLLTPSWVPGRPLLALGMIWVSKTGAKWRFRYDNVVFNLR